MVFQKSLYVGGYLNLGSPATVGTKSTPIGDPVASPGEEVYIAGGCQYFEQAVLQPCVKDGTVVSGKAASTNVFTNTLFTQNGTPQPPYNPSGDRPDLPERGAAAAGGGQADCPQAPRLRSPGGWYRSPRPGHNHPCTTSSTTPAGNPFCTGASTTDPRQ